MSNVTSPNNSVSSRFKIGQTSPTHPDTDSIKAPLVTSPLATDIKGSQDLPPAPDFDALGDTATLSEVDITSRPNSTTISATPESTITAGVSVKYPDLSQFDGQTGERGDEDQLIKSPDNVGDTNLYLYHDDIKERPHVASAISSMANYSAVIQQAPTDPDAKQPEKANLGTLLGVYVPCIQNIFGVILFIRMTWIVGTAGAIEGFLVVLTSCSVTMLTAISMSAIATNGVVPGGGSYFMISRALGPEFGGAVGILFYIGTTFAGAMYIIGAVEIAMIYILPQMSLFGDDLTDDFVKFNNYRVYGTLLLMIMGFVVFLGVNFVNKLGGVALICVLMSILSIYVGIFVNAYGNDKANICVLGTRLLMGSYTNDTCSRDLHIAPNIWDEFCTIHENKTKIPRNETTEDDYLCDDYFNANNISFRRGIRGMATQPSMFMANLRQKYYDNGYVISDSREETEFNLGGKSSFNYAQVDVFTSFTILIGIFFPSVTGIMAGSNRSGDLADPQKSIPTGTICAILTTGTVYLSSVLLFSATVDPLLLRDKFGQSIGGSLVIGNVAWPHPKVIEIGSLLSTFGAGLQSLTGAPRLLSAIAKDGIIPILQPLGVLSKSGEPTRALGFTLCLCTVAVLIGDVDAIAPLLSMFFLMCYGFVNLACALQTLLRTPNWRPRFKFYHWSLSLLGVFLCVAVMFMTSWYFALLAMGIAGIVYKYIEYRGAEKEWGDGIRGLALSAARFSLLRLEEGPPHTKNWRPQILILSKLDDKLNVKHKRLFTLAAQLKAGKGLTIGVSVVEGEFGKMYGESQAARQSIRQAIQAENVKGFPEVVVAESVTDGISHLIQTSGLGGMKPNTVILGWPNNWRKKEDDSNRVFVDAIRSAGAAKMALLVPKGIQRYPDSGDSVKGNIDIWWIVHDGGLLMLLPFLLKQHRTWRKCRMRIFTVAQPEDNSIQMKKDLITFLYHLRIEADVEVVEMHDSDVSAYTYERTLIMEQRNEMLNQMQVSKKSRGRMVDTVLDSSRGDLGVSTQKSPSKVTFPDGLNGGSEEGSHLYQGVNHLGISQQSEIPTQRMKSIESITPENSNVRRMHTAVKLNESIVSKSHDAKLVLLNLPGPPKITGKDKDSAYMEFLEVLTEGLERVLMVRGGGREVITIYS